MQNETVPFVSFDVNFFLACDGFPPGPPCG
jgi:hypothetical protein